MITELTAADITILTRTLTDLPLGRLATAAKTGDRFRRFLAQQIGEDRAAAIAPLILTGGSLDKARGRLLSELHLLPAPSAEPEAVKIADRHPETDPVAASNVASWPTGPKTRQRTNFGPLEAAAKGGQLPPPPDFTAPTHARFRSKLEGLTSLAEKGDIAALRAVPINPVSSSPKALARYRDLCVIALEVREGSA